MGVSRLNSVCVGVRNCSVTPLVTAGSVIAPFPCVRSLSSAQVGGIVNERRWCSLWSYVPHVWEARKEPVRPPREEVVLGRQGSLSRTLLGRTVPACTAPMRALVGRLSALFVGCTETEVRCVRSLVLASV